jgi:serine protease inhibitor
MRLLPPASPTSTARRPRAGRRPRPGPAAVTAVAVALVAAGLLTGSGRAAPPPLPTAVDRGTVRLAADVTAPDVTAFGRAGTAFGLDLLSRLNDPARNTVLSPTSLESGLGMAYLGAAGPTAAGLAAALRLPAGGPALDAGLRQRTLALRGLTGTGVTYAASDLVWADTGEPTSPAYLDRVATGYDAGVRRLDIEAQPERARGTINAWVGAQTRGHIPALLPPGSLDASTGWVLTDAVYLRADWATPFQARDTGPGPFRTATGGTGTASYLHRGGTFGYAHSAGWTAVALPYAGNRLELLALVPDTAGTPLRTTALDTVAAALAPTPLRLGLPRVDLATAETLNDQLGAMGMADAFRPGVADFSGLSPRADHLSFVRHAATMAVGERGTEASAATGTGIEVISAPAGQQVTFDHPYLMLVRDRTTGETLFIAGVNDPSAR